MVSQGRAWGLWCVASGALLAAGVWFRVYEAAGDDAVETVPTEGDMSGAMDVLLRGQVHEGLATPVSLDVEPSPIVPKQPPPPITEVPPDVRPAGDNVQWIPGYWGWDEASRDFIWNSGLWRHVPPGRRWVPGYWAEADGGWRWQVGTWVEADTTALDYLPPPQPSLERGPTSEAPSEEHVWAPGCWLYAEDGYRWRPGFWMRGQPDWCWVPDHYVWTPFGALFAKGYWDYTLEERGTPFCPVAFRGRPYLDTAFRYTPSVVLDTSLLLVQLFVDPRCHSYCFGDYYGDRFLGLGIYPFYQTLNGRHGYDPLLTYCRWESKRQGYDVDKRLRGWHEFYQGKPDLRPLHKFPVAGGATGGTRLASGKSPTQRPVLGQSLQQLAKTPERGQHFVPVTAKEKQLVSGTIGSMTSLSNHRKTFESSGSAAGRRGAAAVAGAGSSQPHTVLKPTLDSPLGGRAGATQQSAGGGAGAAGKRQNPNALKLPTAGTLLGSGSGQASHSATGAGAVANSGKLQNSSKSSATTPSWTSGSSQKGTTRAYRSPPPSPSSGNRSKR